MLKDYTAPADIFNLFFFVVAFGVALAHLIIVDPNLARTMAFVSGLVTFKMTALPAPALWFTATAVVLLGLLVAYIPLTHMSHFIGKYFAYHSIPLPLPYQTATNRTFGESAVQSRAVSSLKRAMQGSSVA